MSTDDYYQRMVDYYDGPKYGGDFAWVKRCIEEGWLDMASRPHLPQVEMVAEARRMFTGRRIFRKVLRQCEAWVRALPLDSGDAPSLLPVGHEGSDGSLS